jgi:hypothetical protein
LLTFLIEFKDRPYASQIAHSLNLLSMRRETKIILSDLPNTAVVFEEFVKSSISKQMQENKWNDMCNSLLYIISNLISYPEKYKHPEKIPERYAKLLG